MLLPTLWHISALPGAGLTGCRGTATSVARQVHTAVVSDRCSRLLLSVPSNLQAQQTQLDCVPCVCACISAPAAMFLQP
jgi:hypothetical protein